MATKELTVADKLKQLVELQTIDSKKDEIKILKGELPMEVSDLEDEIIGLETRVNKVETSIEEVNNIMKKYALEGDLVEQIKYSLNNELVSSDIVGTSAPAIFDSNATIVSGDGKNIVMYVWYDNEYGYSRQVLRLSKHIAEVRRKRYY